MVEVRTYEGDAQDASAFVNRVWGEYYAAQGPLTEFQPRLLDWVLFGNPLATPEYRLGAYKGGKLAGVLFTEPIRLRLGDQDVDGTYGSWFSVDPAFRGEGVGQKLAQEMSERQRERGSALVLACLADGSAGERFWKKMGGTRTFDSLGLWLHVFDMGAVARWATSAPQRALFSLASRWPRRPPVDVDTQGIRPYHPSDLPACMGLVDRSMESVSLGYGYTTERLAHQLQYRDVPRTLVLERHGSVRGLVNYYLLPMNARGALTIALVDLMAFHESVPRAERKRLLRVAMRDMVAKGAQCSAMLRSPCVSAGLMLGSGWVPWSGGMRVACLLPSPDVLWPTSPRVFTHLR
ncbi:GNAT family N-acetyltransferase [Myxococcus sp. K38C18041901]|uniref:GNAT family N-acetyltransferase n=1 Tax=Myxococcus guangdongensis TaxID=2906760 RepID=UPI0020A7C2FA|nr:GNAT family N-acetyltransferase [Myxococcus guangdongensis]MCP3065532.1 GNAT family N-acetyltransferase [Myxococcus guangdongensis]